VIWKFTINPWLENLVTNEKEFLAEIKAIDEIGYYYPHVFKNNKISTYWSVVISVSSIDRLEVIKALYGIEPSKVFSDGKIFHFVFNAIKGMSSAEYHRYWRSLSFLYKWTQIDYHFYSKYKVEEKYSAEVDWKDLHKNCSKLFRLLTVDDNYEKELSLHNYMQYEKTKEIPLLEIAEYFKESISQIDILNNIHMDYGYPFQYVLNFFTRPSLTYDFFNEKYELDFQIEKEDNWDIINDWVILGEGGKLMIDKNWYFSLNEGKSWLWERKDITDFFIKVYYQIIWEDGLTRYIVSFISAGSGAETPKVMWCNTTSVTMFSDFMQQYWNFHFYWTAIHIKELHKHVTETRRIPIIRSVIWYGHHKEEWVIIFKNWILDTKEKLFTQKKDDENYYFNYNWDWYIVIDNVTNPLASIAGWVPVFNEQQTDMDDVYNFVDSLYKDDSWTYLILLSFGMFGYMLYWDPDKPFPIIFTRWITGSGKTSFNALLKRIWGMEGAGVEFSGSSQFSFTHAFSLLKQFPYFISEYREWSYLGTSKVSMLRSVFDRSGQTKWRADQTTTTYNYNVLPILEWEEMIMDGAVRTRCIQKQFLHKHRIDWNFDAIVDKGSHLLDWLMNTYIYKSSWKKYKDYLSEGFDLFKPKTSESRIAENIANIYAGCMCFDKKKKDFYLNVLYKILEFQDNDFQDNWTWKQILKVLSTYLSSMKSMPFITPVREIPKLNALVIDWALFEAYANRNRLELTLKLDSYKEHLEAMGFTVWMYDTWEDMIDWILVPIDSIPKTFLVDPVVYDAYKNFTRLQTLSLWNLTLQWPK